MVGTTRGEATTGRLTSYLPRIASGWSRQWPDRTWRAVDGSLVFVDISGFTALSERLAARGAIGAEELTEILSSSFSELLAVAYADGGSLLKFGGDALLLLFDGAGHAHRACRAALRMRVAMRRVGNLRTTVGAVRLRMSVGVHSGQVHLFRVGTSHRELIVTGPTASETVVMEGTAEAGEIVVSAVTASLVDPGLVGAPKGPGFLLRNRLQEEIQGFPEAPPGEDVADCIPLLLRDHLAAGTVASEHRHAAIAFIHFDGIDDLIRSEGPATAAGALQELVAHVQAAVDEAGVTFLATDIDHDGGKIILVGGVPRALGDDEGRVLRAVRRIVDQPRALPVRVGVNRGHVFAGEVGPDYRKTYTIMGDAVNLSARLMAKAPPGRIYVSGSALELSRTLFATEPLEPFYVKGKSKPVQAFALGAATGTQDVVGLGDLALFGRDHELAELSECYDAVVAGDGRVIEIEGEVGIGKSRLVTELIDRVQPTLVHEVRCEHYESSTPFFGVGVLVRAALGLSSRTDPSTLRKAVAARAPQLLRWLPLLAESLDLRVDDDEHTRPMTTQARAGRRARAVSELIRLSTPPGSILLLEDVQWLDDASAVIITELVREIERSSVLVCLTRRPEGGGLVLPDDLTELRRVRLRPLTDDAADALVKAATSATPVPGHRRKEIIARAGGNPLFLEQLSRTVTRHIGDDAPLPGSVEALVAAEIDDLRPEDRHLVANAAVLGESFELDLLERLVGADGFVDVAAAVKRVEGLLRRDANGRLRFRHRLVRDVAYERLPFRRRQALHLRAGQLIEEAAGDALDERRGILSLHYFHAGEYERACSFALAAGMAARDSGAPVEALELFQRALAAARRVAEPSGAEMAELWNQIALAAWRVGDISRARDAVREAVRGAPDPALAAQRCALAARIEEACGKPVNAVRWTRRGLRMIPEQRLDAEAIGARASLEAFHGWSRYHGGQYRSAQRWCESAIASAGASGNRRAEASATMCIALCQSETGAPDAEDHMRRAVSIYEELEERNDLATALLNLGAMVYFRGRWAEALALYDRAAREYERIGQPVDAAWGASQMAEVLIDQGRLDEARRLLADVSEVWAEHRFSFGEAIVGRLSGRLALRSDDAEAARSVLVSARAVYESFGVASRVMEIDVLLAECLLRTGETGKAIGQLLELERSAIGGAGAEMLSTIHRLLAYGYAAKREIAEAWAALDESLSVARSRMSPLDIALALEAFAAVGEMAGREVDPAADVERQQLLAGLGVLRPPAPPVAVAS